jgi:hypothetical protein
MADGHVLSQRQRKAWIGMQNGSVLNIGSWPNRDLLVVAANHRAEPDTGSLRQTHPADDNGCRGNPAVRMGFDTLVSQAIFHRKFLLCGCVRFALMSRSACSINQRGKKVIWVGVLLIPAPLPPCRTTRLSARVHTGCRRPCNRCLSTLCSCP